MNQNEAVDQAVQLTNHYIYQLNHLYVSNISKQTESKVKHQKRRIELNSRYHDSLRTHENRLKVLVIRFQVSCIENTKKISKKRRVVDDEDESDTTIENYSSVYNIPFDRKAKSKTTNLQMDVVTNIDFDNTTLRSIGNEK